MHGVTVAHDHTHASVLEGTGATRHMLAHGYVNDGMELTALAG